ncbi:MAG: hypothetical protein KBB37_12830 [Bacteroidia bacterium]|nr:hypothetical protein [Bacteroidia bacterium]MBP7262161.1 hypothetical protein [Bacteroidia bacterium]MBP9181267.1 hypothetical protein [Bacteroidia bacterium]MBP9725483.1 hypothetical protein [Bacteroidia bacterium]
MKKIIFTALVSIFTITIAFSQDIITKKSGEDIQAKVLEVTTTEIKYKKFDNQNGPTFIILKSDVLMIRYENGTKDIFNEDKKNESVSSTQSSGDLFIQGQKDALRFYKGYKGAGTGTLIAGLVSPLVGLIPAIACSSTEPKEINLNYPNADLMKKSDYYNGYTQKAKKIKQGKVWTNWGIAFGVNLVAVLVLLN